MEGRKRIPFSRSSSCAPFRCPFKMFLTPSKNDYFFVLFLLLEDYIVKIYCLKIFDRADGRKVGGKLEIRNGEFKNKCLRGS